MDTVKGDMGNTQSLNRYAYVEGNPVNLFDPFGLSPMDSDSGGWMRLLHSTLNILGFVPGPFGMVMDAVNAAIYLCEGDYANALCSAVSVFCGVGGSLLAKFGGKAAKTAVNIFKVGSGACGAVMCVSNAAKGAAAIKKEYRENGGHITFNMVCNAMSVVENGVGFYMSGKSFVSGAKGLNGSGLGEGLKSSGFGNGLKNGIAGLWKKISASFKSMDNRGCLDLSRFGGRKGGSNTVQIINNKFPSDNQVGKRFNYTIENGRVYIENSVPKVEFVIDMDGNLHIGRGHSYLSGGGSVQAAGTMKVNSQGYIRLITNQSGHFQPTTAQALNYPTILRNAGLNVDNAWIRIEKFYTSMSNYVIDSEMFYNGPIKNMS